MSETLRQSIRRLISLYETEKSERARLESELEKAQMQNETCKEQITELKKEIDIKDSIKAYGVDEKYFLETLDEMSEQAFNDQCTGANPRYPLVSELKELYLTAYYGKDGKEA